MRRACKYIERAIDVLQGAEQPRPGIVKKQIVDNALDVIINFIYWEFHMYIITEIYYKMKPLLASLLNLR